MIWWKLGLQHLWPFTIHRINRSEQSIQPFFSFIYSIIKKKFVRFFHVQKSCEDGDGETRRTEKSKEKKQTFKQNSIINYILFKWNVKYVHKKRNNYSIIVSIGGKQFSHSIAFPSLSSIQSKIFDRVMENDLIIYHFDAKYKRNTFSFDAAIELTLQQKGPGCCIVH